MPEARAALTARRRAEVTFAVLALTALLLAASFATLGAAGGPADILAGHVVLLAPLGVLLEVIAAQVAFVAGCLALLRALRLRVDSPPETSALVWNRTTVAASAGALAALGTAAYALDFAGVMPSWWVALSASPLVLALVLALIAFAPRPRTAAPARAATVEVASDLPPLAPLIARLRLDERPWLSPLLVGGPLTLVVLAGTALAERSLLEGLERAIPEALAIALGYALLGRRLGLRQAPRR